MVDNLIKALVVEFHDRSLRAAEKTDSARSGTKHTNKRMVRRQRMTSTQDLYTKIEPWNVGKDALQRSYALGSQLLDDELLSTAEKWVQKKIVARGEEQVHTVHDLVGIYHAKH